MSKIWDYSGLLGARYMANGDRIIYMMDHAPRSGIMVMRWIRDDGEEYLDTIMRRFGREMVPKCLPEGAGIQNMLFD